MFAQVPQFRNGLPKNMYNWYHKTCGLHIEHKKLISCASQNFYPLRLRKWLIRHMKKIEKMYSSHHSIQCTCRSICVSLSTPVKVCLKDIKADFQNSTTKELFYTQLSLIVLFLFLGPVSVQPRNICNVMKIPAKSFPMYSKFSSWHCVQKHSLLPCDGTV